VVFLPQSGFVQRLITEVTEHSSVCLKKDRPDIERFGTERKVLAPVQCRLPFSGAVLRVDPQPGTAPFGSTRFALNDDRKDSISFS